MTDKKGTCATGSTQIVRIGAVARDSLDIDFDNGCILILSVELILNLPGFEILAEDDRIYYPKTDGGSIYWRDGPRSLSIVEVLRLVCNSSATANG